MKSVWFVLAAVLAAVLLNAAVASAADAPAAPKVSTFAPAKDLDAQVDAYIRRLESSVETEEEFKDSQGKLIKEANALILIALAVGLHDEDAQYKAASAGLMKAAQELAAAKDYAAAKAGVAAVKKATESKDGAAATAWVKAASLAQLMKQVPTVNTRLKRNTRTAKSFKSKAKDNAGDSAVIAVIAQGSMADTSEAKGDAQVKQWYDFCAAMRDAAASVNKAVHAEDADGAGKAMKALNKTCDDCHEVFHKEAIGKTDEE